MFTGVGQLASPLILLLCLIMIGYEGISWKSLGYSLIFWFFIQYFSYYFIGAASRIYWEVQTNYWVAWKKIVIQSLTSLTVILAYQQYFYRRLCQDDALHRVLILLFIPMVISMSILILQPVFGVHSFIDANRNNERGLGVFKNPNTAATLANMGLVLTIDFLFRYPSKWFRFTIILIMAVVACVLPLSRTGFIVMCAVLVLGIFYFLFKPRVHGRFRFVQSFLFIGLPIMVISYVALNYDYIKEEQLSFYTKSRVESIEAILTKGKFDSETTAERTDVWAYAFEAIPKRPFSGYGLGYFDAIPGWIGVHNTFLVTAGNSGIVPAILLVFILMFTGLNGLLKQRTGFIILGLTTVTTLTFMTSHNGYSDKVLNILFILPVLFAAYDRHRLEKLNVI